MRAALLSLFLALGLLMTCVWFHRLHTVDSRLPLLLGICIFAIDYAILQYLGDAGESEMLRYLWIRLAIAMSVPLLILKGNLTGWGCLAPALIGSGLLLLLLKL